MWWILFFLGVKRHLLHLIFFEYLGFQILLPASIRCLVIDSFFGTFLLCQILREVTEGALEASLKHWLYHFRTCPRPYPLSNPRQPWTPCHDGANFGAASPSNVHENKSEVFLPTWSPKVGWKILQWPLCQRKLQALAPIFRQSSRVLHRSRVMGRNVWSNFQNAHLWT